MLKWLSNLFGGSESPQAKAQEAGVSAQVNKPQTSGGSMPSQQSHYVSATELKKKLDSGEKFILLDVREQHEFDHARIPGSIHIPMGEIHARYKELGDDPNAEVIVHCHHGGRSEVVMHQLWGLGYQNAKNMVGGIDAWSLDVDPKVPRY